MLAASERLDPDRLVVEARRSVLARLIRRDELPEVHQLSREEVADAVAARVDVAAVNARVDFRPVGEDRCDRSPPLAEAEELHASGPGVQARGGDRGARSPGRDRRKVSVLRELLEDLDELGPPFEVRAGELARALAGHPAVAADAALVGFLPRSVADAVLADQREVDVRHDAVLAEHECPHAVGGILRCDAVLLDRHRRLDRQFEDSGRDRLHRDDVLLLVDAADDGVHIGADRDAKGIEPALQAADVAVLFHVELPVVVSPSLAGEDVERDSVELGVAVLHKIHLFSASMIRL